MKGNFHKIGETVGVIWCRMSDSDQKNKTKDDCILYKWGCKSFTYFNSGLDSSV